MIALNSEYIEKFLDWLVYLDVAHYKTEPDVVLDYKPSGKSHFYLKGSQERFTSEEMLLIFSNSASDETNENWQYAVAEHADWKKRNNK